MKKRTRPGPQPHSPFFVVKNEKSMRGLANIALPLGVITDSYKASHADLYPPGTTELEAVRERGARETGRRRECGALP